MEIYGDGSGHIFCVQPPSHLLLFKFSFSFILYLILYVLYNKPAAVNVFKHMHRFSFFFFCLSLSLSLGVYVYSNVRDARWLLVVCVSEGAHMSFTLMGRE